MIVHFEPWSIDALPDLRGDKLLQRFESFMFRCEDINATFIDRAKLDLIRRLQNVHHRVRADVHNLLETFRRRHSDILGAAARRRAASRVTSGGTMSSKDETILNAATDSIAHNENDERERQLIESRHALMRTFQSLEARSESQNSDAPHELARARRHSSWATSQMVRNSLLVSEAFTAIVQPQETQNDIEAVPEATVFALRNVPSKRYLDQLSSSQRLVTDRFENFITNVASAGPALRLHAYRAGTSFRLAIDEHRNLDVWKINTLVLGGPGTGKSFLVKQLVLHFEQQLSNRLRTAIVAPTGGAARIHVGRGRTLHSLLPESARAQDVVKDRKRFLTQFGYDVALLGLLVVDEISMVGPHMLNQLDEYLRRTRNSEQNELQKLPFGGVAMLFVGDLFQLPPVHHTSLAKVTLEGGSHEAESPASLGAALFRKFPLIELNEQKRAEGDVAHTTRLRYARAEMSRNDIDRDLSVALRAGHSGLAPALDLSVELTQKMCREWGSVSADREAYTSELFSDMVKRPFAPLLGSLTRYDPTREGWHFTDPQVTFVCLDNATRMDINVCRARAFAKVTRTCVFKWLSPCDELEKLREDDPELYAALFAAEKRVGRGMFEYFTKGAPVDVTRNISVRKGVVNNGRGVYYALGWRDDAVHRAMVDFMKKAEYNAAHEDGPIEVLLEHPPDVVFVEFDRKDVGEETSSTWPANETSVPGRVVLPFFANAGDDKRANSDRKFLTSSLAVSMALHKRLRPMRFDLTLGFAVTQWKVQGMTVDKLVVYLPPRKRAPHYNSFGLYVMFSRVKAAGDICFVEHDKACLTAPTVRGRWSHLLSGRTCAIDEKTLSFLACYKAKHAHKPHVKYYDAVLHRIAVATNRTRAASVALRSRSSKKRSVVSERVDDNEVA